MKQPQKKCFFIIFVCGLLLSSGFSLGLAAEGESPLQAAESNANSDQEEPQVYFETEGDLFLGYRWLSTDDSLKAAEYFYPYSSAVFGLDLVSCPLPFRYHVNAEFDSKYDFYSDAGFAYKDLVLFRDILVGARHNLEHYDYQFAGEPPDLIYTDRNTAENNYLNFVSNLMSLRLKASNFPFHTFVNYRHVKRDGRVQQRFLLNYFGDLDLNSESRDIDWKSDAVRIGVNSHLGPVEIEYTYDQDKFDPGHNNVLYDSYSAVADVRPEDIYQHNVVPETETSAHAIKIHSSYTGGIVASATLANLNQKNNYSLTESTTWKGAFDFSWIPDPAIGLFFKYRHRTLDLDTPSVATLQGQTNILSYPVRPGISYDKDVLSLTSRYKPLQMLSLFAGYEFSVIDRKDLAEWNLLPSQTKVHTVDFKARATPLDRLTLKALYEFKNYDEPSYNTTPGYSNKLRLTGNYTPFPTVNLYMEYLLYVSERDALKYHNFEPSVLLSSGERKGRRDEFLASLTKGFTPQLSLTLSWFYQRWKVEQDLTFGKWSETDIGHGDYPYIDMGVPYTDTSNSFSLALLWLLPQDFTLTGDITYTKAEGSTLYTDVVGGASYSLPSFSNLELTETIFSLGLAKKFHRVWEIGLSSYLDIFNDKSSSHLDGNIFTTTFALKRYF
jgi:hypothetical protein